MSEKRLDPVGRVADAIRELSSRIHGLTLLQIAATVAVIVTAIIGESRLADVRNQRESFADFQDQNLTYVQPLRQAWAVDGPIVYTRGVEYSDDVLTKASTLLLIETLFTGWITLTQEGNADFDDTRLKATSESIGVLAQQLNRLRQALPALRTAVQQGRLLDDLNSAQLRAYREYLALHEGFADGGRLQDAWTDVCNLAEVVRHLRDRSKWTRESEDVLAKVVTSERGRTVLDWAGAQLVRRSQAAGDFVSTIEYFGTEETGAMTLGLLEMAGEATSFRTPRMFAVEQFFVTSEGEAAKVADLDRALDALAESNVVSLAEGRREWHRLKELVENLEADRRVAVPGIDIEVPRDMLWLLLLVNGALLGTLIQSRQRALRLAAELGEGSGDWQLVMRTLPYALYYDARSLRFWAVDLHYQAVGTFGLGLAMLTVYVSPTEHRWIGWLVCAAGYLVACALTVMVWTRFHQFAPVRIAERGAAEGKGTTPEPNSRL